MNVMQCLTQYNTLSILTSNDKTDDIFSILIENDKAHFEALTGTNSSSSTSDTAYTKVVSSSESVSESITSLSNTSLWDETDESYSKETTTQTITSFVNAYNTLLSNISNVGKSISNKYKPELVKIISNYSSSLSEVGITADTDGKLSIDSTTLAAADTSSLETLFGSNASFISEISDTVTEINSLVSKALSIQNSLSSTYTSTASESTLSSIINSSSYDSQA